MGWCSGDRMLADVWLEIRPHIPEEKRVDLLVRLVHYFEGEDMDCYDHVIEVPEGKAALKQIHSSWFEWEGEN